MVRQLAPLCRADFDVHGRFPHQPLCHFSQVLRGRSQEELVACTTQTSEPQAVQPQYSLQVREQHLDFLTIAA